MANKHENFGGFSCSHSKGCCFDLEQNSIVVMPDCHDEIDVLVHECTHAAINLMAAVGAKDDETLCHLSQWAFRQILPYWIGDK